MEKYRKFVSENVSQKRYEHSLRVADVCEMLALEYKLDEKKAYITGLLHDVAKEKDSDWHEKILKELKLENEDFYQIPNIHHAYSAKVLLEDFNLDFDILNAIEDHVEGSAKISRLGMILFIADFIEPNRTFKNATYVRDTKFDSLTHMYATCLNYSYNFIKTKGLTATKKTEEAYNRYKDFIQVKDYTVGVVGTSQIAEYFCEGIKLIDGINVEYVYSRNEETGKTFATQNRIKNYTTDYKKMLGQVDIVYIASPNAIHYNQALEALNNKCHVLVEKPMTTSYENTLELFDLAKQNDLFLMEAVTTQANPLMKVIKDELKGEVITHVDLKLMQQSRHYPALKNGDYVNVFDPKMGGGARYDLGVYLMYFLIDIFGKPNKVYKNEYTFDNRADLTTNFTCIYDNFQANLCASKISFNDTKSTIVTENKLIKINSVSDLYQVEVFDTKGNLINNYKKEAEHRFIYELSHFKDVLDSSDYVSYYYTKQKALDVIECLTK